jgi:hypothetical protein
MRRREFITLNRRHRCHVATCGACAAASGASDRVPVAFPGPYHQQLIAFRQGLKQSVTLRVRIWLLNIAGRTINSIGCQTWPPIWFAVGECDRSSWWSAFSVRRKGRVPVCGRAALAAQHYIPYASFVFLHYGVLVSLSPRHQIQLRFFFIRVFACFLCFLFTAREEALAKPPHHGCRTDMFGTRSWYEIFLCLPATSFPFEIAYSNFRCADTIPNCIV